LSGDTSHAFKYSFAGESLALSCRYLFDRADFDASKVLVDTVGQQPRSGTLQFNRQLARLTLERATVHDPRGKCAKRFQEFCGLESGGQASGPFISGAVIRYCADWTATCPKNAVGTRPAVERDLIVGADVLGSHPKSSRAVVRSIALGSRGVSSERTSLQRVERGGTEDGNK
jgi:hypothetical protein